MTASTNHRPGQPLPPIQRSILGDQVAARLRTMIVTEQLPDGHRLVESALSAEFGVSRGPIRDALVTLQAEGLVASKGRGLAVVSISEQDLDELFSLREILESFALRLSAERTDVDWSDFDAHLEAMESAADAGDSLSFAVADLEFHTAFYRAAKHRRLLNVWNEYRPTFAALLEVSTAQDKDLHPSADSHRQLIERLRGGDLSAALQELSEHLQGANDRLKLFKRRQHEGQHSADH